MKRVFKITLYFFLIVLGFIVCLIIFLDVYYSVLEKKQAETDMELDARFKGALTSALVVPAGAQGEVLNLIPVPKKVKFSGGHYIFKPSIKYSVDDSLAARVEEFLKMNSMHIPKHAKTGADIQFIFSKDLPRQGYTLEIKPDRMIVHYSNQQGLYYSIISLKVLNQNYSGRIPCVSIEDSPDLEVRGLMLDISRNKVPTKETLLSIAQLLSDLKYNHFELYIEGFSFAYPSFKNLWQGKETPVTSEEIKELDKFCRDHFIDLTANQNSLGHMMAWLATDEYKDLAECPKGYKIMGLFNMKGTLDPIDPRSFELVSRMTEDLLPNFTSSNFNVNLDEPFELGKGKSKEICEQRGEGEVYMDYAIKLHDLLVKKNKKVMMWADIVLRHPETISRVPKDVTLLDWGYEADYPFERHCKTLQSSGLNYMVCPGTSSWTSIAGRTENMLANIESATTNGVKYGTKGMLLTDWGDMGHWQYLPVSYAGYTAGAALSWNANSRQDMPLSQFLNSYVFKDKGAVMGDLALDLGRYNRFEEFQLFNMTTTMLSFQFGLRDKIMINAIFEKVLKSINDMMGDLAPEMISTLKENYNKRHTADYKGLQKFIGFKEALLKKTRIQTSDSLLIRDEYENSMRLIKLGSDLQNYITLRSKLTIPEEESILNGLKKLGNEYLDKNRQLWMVRNKPGGYESSVAALSSVLLQVDDRLLLLNKSAVSRGINRLLERIGTAGAVLYLKLT